ncbi:hypothetical protein MKW98_025171 [Papaver atlanticum]|uniref:PSD13 N-terminal domain-containing protein n=1 Tax=Papaver atlanticum TaxID=357466 RepID=A0AAD4S242_9MAGN|nr:hypothetical protein MKW98_025171 [Papaver atlanticum]
MAALQYLVSQRSAQPEFAEWHNSLIDLHQRKLWHQLTLKLDQFVALAIFQAGDTLMQLYHNFITEFETKISVLKLAHFAVIVSRQYAEKEAAIGYLEGIIEKLRASRETRIEEPILFIKMQIVAFRLEKGEQKECKNLLDDGTTTLDSMTDIDPSVYASNYWVSSQYHKSRQEFSEDLALDLSLAAVLGDYICGFEELLAHPIIKSILGTKVLECVLNSLVLRPAEDRTIPLNIIAARTKLSVEDVELLLMKSLSVHLIEGITDQVEATILVSRVRPIVLGITQIESLRDRLDNWVDKVHTALLSVESETPELVAS